MLVLTLPYFDSKAECTSCINVIEASVVEEFNLPLNYVPGISSQQSTIYNSLLAIIFSRILPRHSSSVMRQYACGCKQSGLLGFLSATTIACLHWIRQQPLLRYLWNSVVIGFATIGHTYLIILYVIWLGPGAMFELVENKTSLISVGEILIYGISSGFL